MNKPRTTQHVCDAPTLPPALIWTCDECERDWYWRLGDWRTS